MGVGGGGGGDEGERWDGVPGVREWQQMGGAQGIAWARRTAGVKLVLSPAWFGMTELDCIADKIVVTSDSAGARHLSLRTCRAAPEPSFHLCHTRDCRPPSSPPSSHTRHHHQHPHHPHPAPPTDNDASSVAAATTTTSSRDATATRVGSTT